MRDGRCGPLASWGGEEIYKAGDLQCAAVGEQQVLRFAQDDKTKSDDKFTSGDKF